MLRVNLRQRGKYWMLDYRNPNGRRRRLSLGSDYRQAQRLVARFTDWLLDGKDPECEMERTKQKEQARSMTLRQFFPVFMKRHGIRQGKKTQDLYRGFFKNFCKCPELISTPIGSITKIMVMDYMQLRMEKGSVTPATANREASLIRNVLSRAVEWDILDRNPLANFRMLKEADKRDVDVTVEQIAQLLDSLYPVMADIVEFAVYTGLRKENILGLKIDQVTLYDLKPGGEVVLTVKGGKKRKKALGKKGATIVKRAIDDRMDGYVFINPRTGERYKSINRTFDRAVRKVGLKIGDSKLRFHDLRHVFASWLNQRNVPLDVLRHLLDHEDRATTDRYTTQNLLALGELLDLMPEIRKKA